MAQSAVAAPLAADMCPSPVSSAIPAALGWLRAVRLAGQGLQQPARRPLQVKALAKRLGDRRGGLGRVE